MGVRQILPEAEKEAIRLYKNKNLTIKEISNIVNISTAKLSVIYRKAFKDGLLKQREPKKTNNKNKFTEEQLKQIAVDYYENGLTLKDIREKYNAHDMQLQRMREIFGVNYKSKTPKRAVEQFDLEGNKIAEYKSVYDAGKKNNIENINILMCCRGKFKTIGGYIWKFKEKENGIK